MKIGGISADKDEAVYGPYVIQRGFQKYEEDVVNDEGAIVHKAGDWILDGDGNRIPKLLGFIAQPVWGMEEFDALCPEPKPSEHEIVFTPKGKKPDYKAPEYLARVEEYGRKRWGYMVLKSLEPSDIEFDDVSIDDPETWGNVRQAFRAVLSQYEFGGLMRLVDEANAVDADKLEANRQSFLSQSKG